MHLQERVEEEWWVEWVEVDLVAANGVAEEITTSSLAIPEA